MADTDFFDEEFTETTDLVSDYLEEISGTEIGHFEVEIEDPSSEGDDEPPEEERETKLRRILFVEESVGPDYAVVADEGNRFFRVQSQYQFWRDVAGYLSEEEIAKFAPPEIPETHPLRSRVSELEEIEPDVQDALAAALESLNQISDEERRELILQLTDVFTDAGLKHAVDSVEEGSGIAGFYVHNKIFPYEEEFSISELNEIIERVRMAAHMAELVLKYAFNMPIDISGTTGGEFLDSELPPSKSNKLADIVDSPFSGDN